MREAVVEGTLQEDVLHGVLYSQSHGNGIQKKKKKKKIEIRLVTTVSTAVLGGQLGLLLRPPPLLPPRRGKRCQWASQHLQSLREKDESMFFANNDKRDGGVEVQLRAGISRIFGSSFLSVASNSPIETPSR